jgi:hypothetical protein
MDETHQAHADLAFMEGLVEEGARAQTTAGAAFAAAGFLYGFQCLIQWAQIVGLIHLPDPVMLVFVILISVAFTVILTVLIWRGRKTTQHSVSTRAWGAAFGGVGLGNLVLCSVFGLFSWRQGSAEVWLLYGVAVCALQGAAWFVAAMMRRQLWLWLVSMGWYTTALSLGVLIAIQDLVSYALVLGLALLFLMALPGVAMVQLAKQAR